MKHTELIVLCSRWALKHKYAVAAITECKVKCTSEVPDILAFKANGQSVLLEIKVDRQDFKADGLGRSEAIRALMVEHIKKCRDTSK